MYTIVMLNVSERGKLLTVGNKNCIKPFDSGKILSNKRRTKSNENKQNYK